LPKPELKLRFLAQQRFGNLSRAEIALIDGAASGRPAHCADTGGGVAGILPNASPYGSDRTIRGDLLRWLCTDPAAAPLVTSDGLTIYDALVTSVPLNNSTVSFPLALLRCAIPSGVHIECARTRRIALLGSHTRGVQAGNASIGGSLYLSGGFTSTKSVHLVDATIEGSLVCNRGSFTGGLEEAICADRVNVRGSVFLRYGFRANGEVRCLSAKVGGTFDCQDSEFTSPGAGTRPDAKALSADGIEVRGDVFLRGIKARGQVRFPGAKIGGQLNCRSGKFFHELPNVSVQPVALIAANIGIGETLILDGGFQSTGRVVFDGARLNSDLVCRGEPDSPVRMTTLELRGACIQGALMLEFCEVSQSLDLRFASVQTLDDRESAWPAKGVLDVERFRYESIAPDAPRDFNSRLRWLKLHKTFHPQPYRQLASTLAAMGQDEDAREVHIALAKHQHEDERAKGFWELRRSTIWWLRLVLKWGLGYGYLPWRPAWAMLALLLIGWGVFTFGHPHLFSPASDEVLLSESFRATGTAPPGYQRFSAFVYSADVLLPIIDFHQETTWLPDSTKHVDLWGLVSIAGAWLRWYLWFHIAMGWILTTLLVVGLTGIVRHRVEEE